MSYAESIVIIIIIVFSRPARPAARAGQQAAGLSSLMMAGQNGQRYGQVQTSSGDDDAAKQRDIEEMPNAFSPPKICITIESDSKEGKVSVFQKYTNLEFFQQRYRI